VLLDKLRVLQKRLKYGLRDKLSIVVFELGFSDRCLVADMLDLLGEIQPNKNAVQSALRDQGDALFRAIEPYPEYFRVKADQVLDQPTLGPDI